VELPDKVFHKPAARLCRDKAGDAENGLRAMNRPLLVRSIDAGSRAREDLCENYATQGTVVVIKGIASCPGTPLVCLNREMHRRLFCRSQHELVSYDNEFTVNWRRGFDRKERS